MLEFNPKKKPVSGINALSPMIGFKHFDLIKGFAIDYLHMVLKGVLKNILDMWYDSKYNKLPYYLCNTKKNLIDKRLLCIKPTQEVCRKPRSLIRFRNDLKANELRSLLLYYLPVIAEGIQKNVYYDHLMLLSSAIFILLKTKISEQDILEAKVKLDNFAECHEKLYGPDHMTMNAHLIKHVSQSVIDIGPLWTQSMFAFETNNGVLAKYVSGTSSVTSQIAEKYILQQGLKFQNKTEEKISDRYLFLGIKKRVTVSERDSAALQDFGLRGNIMSIFYRIRVKNVVFTSKLYKDVKSLDYAVQLKDESIGMIYFYFEHENNKYGYIESYKVVRNIAHIVEVESTNNFRVFPVEQIKKKMFCMTVIHDLNISKIFLTYIPNHYEKT